MKNTETNYSKMDVRYWREKVFNRGAADYECRIAFAGNQKRFPLRTPNKDVAAVKARDIYVSLQKHGWELTLTKFKPWTVEEEKALETCTVGEYIKTVQTLVPIKPTTFTTYSRKFRFLVSQIKSFKGGKDRHDYYNGGSDKWRELIDMVTLAEITPSEVSSWQTRYIAANSANPLKAKSATHTARSVIRNAKALFSADILLLVCPPSGVPLLKLPTPLPFDGVTLAKAPRTRYKSKINAPLIAKLAYDELQKDNPELFKMFLLAFGAGLRRGEIDKLTWKQFNWTVGTISIETTEYGSVKTEDSEQEIDIGADLVAYFKDRMAGSESEFVITSNVAVDDQPKHWNHYRCDGLFKSLIEWLHSKGVNARNPIHTLRKEFGSLINQQYGIFAASAALRHSNISITRDTYVDKKQKIALNLGELMSAEGGK
jgi:integrase